MIPFLSPEFADDVHRRRLAEADELRRARAARIAARHVRRRVRRLRRPANPDGIV